MKDVNIDLYSEFNDKELTVKLNRSHFQKTTGKVKGLLTDLLKKYKLNSRADKLMKLAETAIKDGKLNPSDVQGGDKWKTFISDQINSGELTLDELRSTIDSESIKYNDMISVDIFKMLLKDLTQTKIGNLNPEQKETFLNNLDSDSDSPFWLDQDITEIEKVGDSFRKQFRI